VERADHPAPLLVLGQQKIAEQTLGLFAPPVEVAGSSNDENREEDAEHGEARPDAQPHIAADPPQRRFQAVNPLLDLENCDRPRRRVAERDVELDHLSQLTMDRVRRIIGPDDHCRGLSAECLKGRLRHLETPADETRIVGVRNSPVGQPELDGQCLAAEQSQPNLGLELGELFRIGRL
jgi:hypothetical protein